MERTFGSFTFLFGSTRLCTRPWIKRNPYPGVKNLDLMPGLQGRNKLLEVCLALTALAQHPPPAKPLKPSLNPNAADTCCSPALGGNLDTLVVGQRDQLDHASALQLR